MHIMLYLRDPVPLKQGVTSLWEDFLGRNVAKVDNSDFRISLDRPVAQLPPDLLEAEDDGRIMRTEIRTSGNHNPPVEGVYDYREVEGKRFYATAEIYHDGSWNLMIEADRYAHAYQALNDIRAGDIAPTKAWAVKQSAFADRMQLYWFGVTLGAALTISSWLPRFAVAIIALLVLLASAAYLNWPTISEWAATQWTRRATSKLIGWFRVIRFKLVMLPFKLQHLSAKIIQVLQEHASYLTRRKNKK